MEKLSEVQSKEIMEACIAGKESGWRDLFRHFYPLARWIASVHLSADRADDIAQETMIALCAAVKAGKVRNLPGYVRTVAHNKCVNFLRKKEPLDYRINPAEQEDELDGIAAPVEIPLEMAEEDAMTALSRYLQEMEHPCSELLKKSYLERKSYDELSSALSIPAAQVGMRIRRCREKFRVFLEKNRPAFFAEVAAFYSARSQGGRYAI